MGLTLSSLELVKHEVSILHSGQPMKKFELEGKFGDWASSLKMNIKDLLNTDNKICGVIYL